MAKKITIAEKFDEVVKVLSGETSTMSTDELVEFINDRKAKAQKKNSSRKETERQKENSVLKGVILKALDNADEGMTVTEIIGTPEVKGFATDTPLSTQRVTAVLQQMIRIDNTVTKEKDGKSMKYSAIG
jgi:hypothetical protein